MNYEQKYKESLERAKEQLDSAKVFDYNNEQIAHDIRSTVYNIFPELKESDDEKIRKYLIDLIIKAERNTDYINYADRERILAWLEKQRDKPLFTYNDILALQCCMETIKKVQEDKELYEQLQSLHDRLHDAYWLEKQGINADKVEPKFHEGDWTVSKLDGKARQISEVHYDEYNSYYVVDGNSVNLEEYDRLHHIWTIEDVKDGDVLVFKNNISGIIICKSSTDYDTESYCRLVSDNLINKKESGWDSTLLVPATKEQRDTLFARMKEEGYEWDKDKKELIKLQDMKARIKGTDTIIHVSKTADGRYACKHLMHIFNKDELDFEDIEVQQNEVVNKIRTAIKEHFANYDAGKNMDELYAVAKFCEEVDNLLRKIKV